MLSWRTHSKAVDSYIQIHSRFALVDSDLRIHCFSCVLPNLTLYMGIVPQDNEDVIRIRITRVINGLLNIVMFQNALIIGDIQGNNQFTTPRFSLDSLCHNKGYVFIELKSFFNLWQILKKPIFLLRIFFWRITSNSEYDILGTVQTGPWRFNPDMDKLDPESSAFRDCLIFRVLIGRWTW